MTVLTVIVTYISCVLHSNTSLEVHHFFFFFKLEESDSVNLMEKG